MKDNLKIIVEGLRYTFQNLLIWRIAGYVLNHQYRWFNSLETQSLYRIEYIINYNNSGYREWSSLIGQSKKEGLTETLGIEIEEQQVT